MQTRIFAPRDDLFNHQLWAETLIGRIIAPLVRNFNDALVWYWFTRYVTAKEEASGDCELSKIPEHFMDPGTKSYKSVRFRFAITDEKLSELEGECRRLVDGAGCAISDVRVYAIVDDLGGDRHLEEPRTPERRQKRAQLVVENYFSIAKLILDALTGPDSAGRYCLPHQPETDPQVETPFRVFHHIFCNATDVPLYIRVAYHTLGDASGPPRHELRLERVRF
jgi:hypothetical protein